EKTIIAPCSISSLAKIHAGFADTLLMRAAAVALKERKKLILGVREMPFSTLNLEHMLKLSQMGVIIAPPIIASYSKANNLEQMENFIVGKWLDLLEIKHNLYEKWQNF
ncbi:UbiX family flavin prenyltransferase, partial [Campylobacter jejuni]|nr:UbiX family flavin prenyltransferase [Campylobacter jejuni]